MLAVEQLETKKAGQHLFSVVAQPIIKKYEILSYI